MVRYTLSFDWRGGRRSFTAPCWHWLARFIGRHIWRLGARRWQIEAGRFATSHIPTEGEPVVRHADKLGLQLPNGWRHYQVRVRPGDAPVLLEEERTNVALWSEGKR